MLALKTIKKWLFSSQINIKDDYNKTKRKSLFFTTKPNQMIINNKCPKIGGKLQLNNKSNQPKFIILIVLYSMDFSISDNK